MQQELGEVFSHSGVTSSNLLSSFPPGGDGALQAHSGRWAGCAEGSLWVHVLTAWELPGPAGHLWVPEPCGGRPEGPLRYPGRMSPLPDLYPPYTKGTARNHWAHYLFVPHPLLPWKQLYCSFLIRKRTHILKHLCGSLCWQALWRMVWQ